MPQLQLQLQLQMSQVEFHSHSRVLIRRPLNATVTVENTFDSIHGMLIVINSSGGYAIMLFFAGLASFGSTGPRRSEIVDFEQIFACNASAVTPSEISSINANRKSYWKAFQ